MLLRSYQGLFAGIPHGEVCSTACMHREIEEEREGKRDRRGREGEKKMKAEEEKDFISWQQTPPNIRQLLSYTRTQPQRGHGSNAHPN